VGGRSPSDPSGLIVLYGGQESSIDDKQDITSKQHGELFTLRLGLNECTWTKED